ncbi:MAG: GNAT family N-acetyltransferase [Pedococcus sp.]
MSLDFRPLTDSDLDAMLDVRVRAFGPMSGSGAALWRAVNSELIADGRQFGVFDGDEMAGCGKARGFEQAWHGRLVPMAGMAGITVLPEFRGRGVGTCLMRGLSEQSVARGEPISALYPATVPVYRHLGWELVGAQSRYALPAAQLRTLGGDTRLRRVRTNDIPELRELCATALRQGRASGPLLWPESEWLRRVTDPETFVYRADDGVVVYGWHGSDLLVHFLWGATESTLRSLWAVVGSGSSVAKTVHAYLSPDDPLFWLLPEEAGHEVEQHGWMLRILDVANALEARGYPTGIDGAFTFTVDDGQGEAAASTYRLSVGGGEGKVEEAPAAEPEGLRVTSRGLAALYAGRPLCAVTVAGLGTGGDPEVAELVDSVFATSTAYLTDYF